MSVKVLPDNWGYAWIRIVSAVLFPPFLLLAILGLVCEAWNDGKSPKGDARQSGP